MIFSQLKIGDIVYIIEVIGTFKKNMEYSIGTVTSISNVYDEPLPPQQLFPIPNLLRKKVVDINILSNGETKKFTVPEDRSTITDSAIGLTISTSKDEIANIIRNLYNIYKTRKESIAKCDEEMEKCRIILNKLDVREIPRLEDNTIKQMQDLIKQLQQILKQQLENKLSTTDNLTNKG